MDRQRQRDVCPGHTCRARAAVSLNHGAVEHDLALAEFFHVDGCPQASPDHAADLLLAAAADAAIPWNALRARRRDHGVFAGDPALAFTVQEGGHLLLDCRAAQHPGVAHADEARGRHRLEKARLDADRPELVGGAPVGASARLRHRVILGEAPLGSAVCATAEAEAARVTSARWASCFSLGRSTAYGQPSWQRRRLPLGLRLG